MDTLLIIGLLFLLLVLRVPVAIALTAAAAVGIYREGLPLVSVLQRFWAGTESWVLMAIPFFILAGTIMTEGGLSRRMVNFSNAVIGFVPGGLANVNIAASMLFGGISGSAVADTSAIGSVLIPEMERRGYTRVYAAAVTVASSPIGMIIPPSIPMIVWSFVSGESLGALFLGGVFPGILVGLGLMAVSTVLSVRRGFQSEGERIDLAALRATWKDGVISLVAPLIIIGGILSGVFTATESAVIAVAYALLVTRFVYREFSFRDLPRVLLAAGKMSASVMFVIGGATAFSWVLAVNQVPQAMGRFVVGLVDTPGQFLLLGSLFLFVLGTFLDTSTIILLVGPILAPIVRSIGVDPILAALIFLVVLATGLITPPLGLCLFVVSSLTGLKVEQVALEVVPFIVLMLAVALLLWIFPELVTWLPGFLQR